MRAAIRPKLTGKAGRRRSFDRRHDLRHRRQLRGQSLWRENRDEDRRREADVSGFDRGPVPAESLGQYHHRILDAIESCVPIEHVMSIDEVACILDRNQQTPEAVKRLSAEIKRAIRERVGECLTISVGAASNKLLAKLASDMKKPDGLTILEPEQMPQKILHLKIEDICGIGANMSRRLKDAGLDTMPKLWRADPNTLQRVWGGCGQEVLMPCCMEKICLRRRARSVASAISMYWPLSSD